MRSYALVILDKTDKILEKYPLQYITDPMGNGFELGLDVIESKLENSITKVSHKKNKINFVVNQVGGSYQLAKKLSRWIQQWMPRCLKNEVQMALEYKDGATGLVLYINGLVTKLDKTEKTFPNVLLQPLEFTTTGHFYQRRETPITIKQSETGKSYPYKYPYNYGDTIVSGAGIKNEYFEEIPITIIINGKITNPMVELLDEEGNSYNRVQVNVDVQQGETLVINSTKRKIYKIDTTGKEIDMVAEVDPEFDTYLYAKVGTSTLNANKSAGGTGFKLTGVWRQYEL